MRADLASLGFRLERRVRVELVGSQEMRAFTIEGGPPTFGLTRLTQSRGGQREALDVAVLRGLHPIWFGRTVVHENMHAWLAEQAIRPVSQDLEEGLCELAAYAWLRSQPNPPAKNLRRLIRTSPDPVYGAGFRAVHAAVRAHGLKETMNALRATGDIPPP